MAKVKAYSSSDIVTMGELEHMRHRAQMYMGDIHDRAVHVQMLKEIVDNSVDEATVADYPFDIHVILIPLSRQHNYQAIVLDNGRGIPLTKLKAALINPRTSGKFTNTKARGNSYNATVGAFGIGAKGVVALAKRFCGVSTREEGAAAVYVEDITVKGETITRRRNQQGHGTVVFFEPDTNLTRGQDELFTDGFDILQEQLEFVSSLLPNATIRLSLSDTRVPITLFKEEPFVIDQTLRAWPITKTCVTTDPNETSIGFLKRTRSLPQNELWSLQLQKPYMSEGIDDRIGYDIHLFYPAGLTKERRDGLMGSVNRTPIHDYAMHHISGLMTVIKEKLATFIPEDDVRQYFLRVYRLPLYGVVTTSFKGAVFGGQLKTEFKDQDFLLPYVAMLRAQCNKQHATIWNQLYDLFAEHIEQSFMQYFNRGTVTASLRNIVTRLDDPESFRACRSTNPAECELFIVEGKSAGGRVCEARNAYNQAVFKMRGKSRNCIQATDAQLRDDKLIQDLVMVVGVHIGAKDLSGLKFNKIIVLVDADDHGHHITTLLMGLFYRMSPLLFENRHIEIASPPLYSIYTGKTRVFMRDATALLEAKIATIYAPTLALSLVNHHTGMVKQLHGDDYKHFCFTIDYVGQLLQTTANQLTIEPHILELMAHVVNEISGPPDCEKIRTILNVERVSFSQQTYSMVITQHGIDITVPLTGLFTRLRESIIPVFEQLHWKDIDICATTVGPAWKNQPVSFYQLYQMMTSLDRIVTVQRYKGLGEMELMALQKSAIDPETRTTISVVELGDVERLYAILDSNPAARKQLVASRRRPPWLT